MKSKKLLSIFILFFTLILGGQSLVAQQKGEQKITATFKGVDASDNFLFEDTKGNPINFHDEDQSLLSDVTLMDEGLVGKQFLVTYRWIDVEIMTSEGIGSGETMKVKRIFNYKLK